MLKHHIQSHEPNTKTKPVKQSSNRKPQTKTDTDDTNKQKDTDEPTKDENVTITSPPLHSYQDSYIASKNTQKHPSIQDVNDSLDVKTQLCPVNDCVFTMNTFSSHLAEQVDVWPLAIVK